MLIVFKLTELSRSCSKRNINIFQISQLMTKDAAMQVEKALINDRLHVSKVS